MRIRMASLLLVAGLAGLALPAQADESAYDTVVVCPQPLQAAMRPWFAHRIRQGRKIGVISDTAAPDRVRAGIRAAAEGGKLTHVLIVGDDHPDRKSNDNLAGITVPSAKIDAKINVRWGSEAHIATDNWYADLDDDLAPDVAIGRITADAPEELATIVGKIIAYENSADYTPWRRRVNFIAGVGGFGMVADSIIDMATKKLITGHIPSGYQTSMTYASLTSPYCPDPRQLPDTAIARHNEGCLFWVYIGHGQRRWLDYMRVDRSAFPIMNVDHVGEMEAASGSPIAVFLACYTGAFDEREDCLGEEMLASPKGPVAVVCGSRVTMPYANAVFAQSMLEQCFDHEHATLGELLLHAKRETLTGKGGGDTRELLDAIATAISPNKEELDVERAEHLALYNLLGDPLLRLHKPQSIEMNVAESATAGEKLEVTGNSDVIGRATIELVCRRDKLTFTPQSRRNFVLTAETASLLTDDYKRANDQRWASHEIDISGGKFATSFDIPEECRGHCHVRVYVEGEDDFALGAADVYVQPRKD